MKYEQDFQGDLLLSILLLINYYCCNEQVAGTVSRSSTKSSFSYF